MNFTIPHLDLTLSQPPMLLTHLPPTPSW